ncbi:metalloregulator ArsR/SmtB family transcription factor [Candidatus Gottesmanbacteria bacterium]|nr:metalloregulator ArsR/SmtB family transcription factor [Candidatus Gottesmanbacteria bacterium]
MLTGKKLIRRSEKEAKVLRAMAHSHRITILHLVSQSDMRLKELAMRAQASQSLLLHHLTILIDAGFVGTYQVGARTFYRLENKNLAEAKKIFSP